MLIRKRISRDALLLLTKESTAIDNPTPKALDRLSAPLRRGFFFAIANRSAVHALKSKTPERGALRCGFDGLLKQMTAAAVRLNSECSENDCTEEEKYGANRKRIKS